MAYAMSTSFTKAFKPVQKRTVLMRSAGSDYAKTLPGITAPTGFFDPLNLSETATPTEVKRFRESELTHGRVCMLAAVGFVVGENLEDYPLFFNFDGAITGPAINQFQQVRQGFWEPLVLFIGLAEAYRVQKGWAVPVGEDFNTLREDYSPGDLGFDPLGLAPKNEAEFAELQTKELNNGRLAMIGVAGFTAQELVNQRGIFEHLFKEYFP